MRLYIHIPFCHRICPYCSFYKHTPGKTDISAFIEALLTEARFYQKQLQISKLTTLYLGGGTPTMLSPSHFQQLITGLRQIFDFTQLQEFSIEANPATFTKKKIHLLQELGVQRVSLGIQSFDNAVLQTLGREHTRDQAIESVNLLRELGLEQLNIDLMFAIPGQTINSWQESLRTAVELNAHHISAYNLTYEEDTEFLTQLKEGNYSENEQNNAQFYELAHQTLTTAGYQHYETSNYALPSHRSLHNTSYWQGADYLGLGPSAVSTVQKTRWKNTPDTDLYIQQINSIQHAKHDIEQLKQEDYQLERIALLLRTTEGLPLSWLKGYDVKKIDPLLEENLATLNNGSLQLIGKGPLLVDSIIEHLIA